MDCRLYCWPQVPGFAHPPDLFGSVMLEKSRKLLLLEEARAGQHGKHCRDEMCFRSKRAD